MNQADDARIRAGLERRLVTVEQLVPLRPRWQSKDDEGIRPGLVRIGSGSVTRRQPPRDRRLAAVLAAAATVTLLLAVGMLGVGAPAPVLDPPASASTGPSAEPSAAPTLAPGQLRPAVEPRLIVPVRPATGWTVLDDTSLGLSLVYLLDEVGSLGYNVSLMIVEPRGVYDPIDEAKLLPLPKDLIGWIADHPDLDAEEPFDLRLAGLPARAIDVTVTYQADGPRGQTAQFIDVGISLNLESPSKKRIVLVELPDRSLLLMFDSRPELFDSSIAHFEDEIALMKLEDRGPAP